MSMDDPTARIVAGDAASHLNNAHLVTRGGSTKNSQFPTNSSAPAMAVQPGGELCTGARDDDFDVDGNGEGEGDAKDFYMQEDHIMDGSDLDTASTSVSPSTPIDKQTDSVSVAGVYAESNHTLQDSIEPPVKRAKSKPNQKLLQELLADAEWHNDVVKGRSKRVSRVEMQILREERYLKHLEQERKKKEAKENMTPEQKEALEKERALEKQKKLERDMLKREKKRALSEAVRARNKKRTEERQKLIESGEIVVTKNKYKDYYAGGDLGLLLNATTFVTGDGFDVSKRREIKPVIRFSEIDESSIREGSQKKGRKLKVKSEKKKKKNNHKEEVKSATDIGLAKDKENEQVPVKQEHLAESSESSPDKTPEPEPIWFTQIDCGKIEFKEGWSFFQDFVYDGKVDTETPTDMVQASQLVRDRMKLYRQDHATFKFQSVRLHYPLSEFREEYLLAIPKDDIQFNPFQEIGTLMELIATCYFPEEFRRTVVDVRNPEQCIIHKYIVAFEASDIESIFECINEFNTLTDKLRNEGIIFKYLQSLKEFPDSIVNEVLAECYTRRVLPECKKLKIYKPFSNEVYGELMPSFLNKVYKDCNLNNTSTFMDLGSGVGNCVIQAALEFGCQSYGVELVKNPSVLADLQLIEFESRCRVLGLKPGYVQLFGNQSFVNNDNVKKIVDKCDVILVNNYLFDTKLNEKVTELFQDLKVGCKIISLKPIVPAGYTLYGGNINSILSRLKTNRYIYEENSVSWTSKGGYYYITEVMESIVEEHFTRFKSRNSRRNDEGYTATDSTASLNAFTNNC